jgi:cell division protein FtsZ
LDIKEFAMNMNYIEIIEDTAFQQPTVQPAPSPVFNPVTVVSDASNSSVLNSQLTNASALHPGTMNMSNANVALSAAAIITPAQVAPIVQDIPAHTQGANTAMSAMGEVVLNATKPPVNIKVVGVGGGGGNAVTHMIRSGVKNVTYITVNTDSQALYKTPADIKIQLGDNGQGAGANPNIARKYAEAARAQLKEALKGADMVFITAGLGKGTGTGASAVVAQVAQELEALTVCVVTKPFTSEGPGRAKLADAAADELEIHSDSIIVVLNSKLEARNPDGLMKEWYQAADDVLKNAVATIVEIIQTNGYQNVDFRDVASVIGANRGRALMGTARATGPHRAKEAATAVVNCDLLEEENLRTARGVLINITAAEDSMRGREITEVIDTIRASFADDVTPIYGTTFDDSMGDEMQVTLIVSGIGARGKVSLVPSLVEVTRSSTTPGAGGYSGRGDFGGIGQSLTSLSNPVHPHVMPVSPASPVSPTTPTAGLRTGTDHVVFNPLMTPQLEVAPEPVSEFRLISAPQTSHQPHAYVPATPVVMGGAQPSIPTLTQEIDRSNMLREATTYRQEPMPAAQLMPAPAAVMSSPFNLAPVTVVTHVVDSTDAASLMFNPSSMSNPRQESQKIVTAMQASGVPNIEIPTFLRNQVN